MKLWEQINGRPRRVCRTCRSASQKAKEKRMKRGTTCLPLLAVGWLAASQHGHLVSVRSGSALARAGRVVVWWLAAGVSVWAAGLTVRAGLTWWVRSRRPSLGRKLGRDERRDRRPDLRLVDPAGPPLSGSPAGTRPVASVPIRLAGGVVADPRHPAARNGTAVHRGCGGERP